MTTYRSEFDGLPLIGFAWWARDLGPLWTYSDLISQGWMKKTIEERLGRPDAYGRNPHGGYAKLYRRDRVAEAAIQAVTG